VTHRSTDGTRRFAELAMGCSATMMAFQVASRATRDALFLSSYGADSLPLMVAVASAVSIAFALSGSRLIAQMGPARAIPLAFAGSAVLTTGEWFLATTQPAAGAVVVWLHVAAIGPVLLSGFWSILNERFDPRTARRVIGRIAAFGTLGGLAGGLLAERSAAWLGVAGTLPVLAVLQGACAVLLRGMPPSTARPPGPGALDGETRLAQIARTSYLRNLALLVLGTSVSAALLDWIFKANTAGAVPPGPALMRIFAAFYAIVALLTFVIQVFFTRLALRRAGLVRSIGALPTAVATGGLVSALIPGPWAVAVVRGIEAVLRGSLFRSGYELLYTPIPPGEKRGTKAILDVGFDRLGDMLGAGLVAVALALPSTATMPVLLGLVVAAAIGTLGIVAQLRRGNVSSIEAGLKARAVELETVELPEWTMPDTFSGRFARPDSGAPPVGDRSDPSDAGATPSRGAPPVTDPLASALFELRSGDPARVRATLAARSPLPGGLVAQGIELLAWDEVAPDAIQSLRAVATRHVGQLVDSLLDPSTDFTVRRRLPPVLSASHTSRAVDGLMGGLVDTRFEVRYRCGRALYTLLAADRHLKADRDAVFEAVRRETRVGEAVWKSQRLLEQLDDADAHPFLDELLRQRASRSLEHVFTLLALVLPREPLRIAFSGLHTKDRMLRGLALEYLESVLPAEVRTDLWPYLEVKSVPHPGADATPRERAVILDELLRSHESIQIDLAELRRLHESGGNG